MDFSLDESQEAARDLARKILGDRATPERLREVERSETRLDLELWRELAKANLVGAGLPEEAGGAGLGFFATALLLEEVGRTVAPVPAWATVCATEPLAAFGDAAARERWLAPALRGELVLTAALEEPEQDAPEALATRAAADGTGFRLDGAKTCVPAAAVAARILVPARADTGGVVLAWVDPQAPGVALLPQDTTSRERRARVELSGVRVAAEDVLAGPERGAEALAFTLERATAALCAMQLGVAERALEIAARYVSERQQFGRPVGSFQAVHQRLADAYIDVETIRLHTWQAAWRLAAGRPATEEVAMAKLHACEAGHRAVYAAQHVHGGIGVDVDYPIHRYTLWEREIELTLGSGAFHLERLGERLAARAG